MPQNSTEYLTTATALDIKIRNNNNEKTGNNVDFC